MKRTGGKVFWVFMVAAIFSLPAQGFAISINTSDIVDGAVTTPKIANGGVTATKLGIGAVETPAIADGAVTGAKIAAGAITDAHITGQIQTSRLNVGTIGGTVAAGDHSHDGVYQKKYSNIAVVAKSGGDFTDPIAAMNDIATWCGAPSANSPCLVKIMPGYYDLNGDKILAQSYVDIQGSGKGNTIISGGSSTTPAYLATYGIVGGSLTDVTVINANTRAAMEIYGSQEIRNLNLKAVANAGLLIAGTPDVADVTIDGASNGITISGFGSGGTFSNIKVLNADTALYNYRGNIVVKNLESASPVMNQGDMFIRDSRFGNLRVLSLEVPTNINAANCQINGQVVRDPYPLEAVMNVKCVNTYDADLNPVTCPTWPGI